MQTLLSQRIRSARMAVYPEVTQREVATRLNKSASAVNLWEKGKTEPNATDLAALSVWFQVSTDWLLGIESGKSSIIKQPSGVVYTVPVVAPSSLTRWHWDTVNELLQTAVNYPDRTAAGMLVESEALGSVCPPGCYAVISKSHPVQPGHIVLASVARSPEPVLRKYIREGGEALLVADDSRYPSFRMDDDAHIIGRVVEVTVRKMI